MKRSMSEAELLRLADFNLVESCNSALDFPGWDLVTVNLNKFMVDRN